MDRLPVSIFCFHLDCNFFSHFGICPRSIFVNMVAPWSNSCSEWISHDDGSVMCCTLFQLRNTKKICLNSNSQNSISRIRTEFESLFECCCWCCVDFISLLLTIEAMAKVNDIRTFLKGQKETDAPALDASATGDVSQSELMMVENQISLWKTWKPVPCF